jgi:hypothetical protein
MHPWRPPSILKQRPDRPSSKPDYALVFANLAIAPELAGDETGMPMHRTR